MMGLRKFNRFQQALAAMTTAVSDICPDIDAS
jgi:hypothetical protein